MVEKGKMSKEIVINPITRIEGHAKITIFLGNDASVKEADSKSLTSEASKSSVKDAHSTKCPA